MKTVVSENILRFDNRSFTYRDQRRPINDTLGYHIHTDMELSVMERGTGIRTILRRI